MGVVLWSPGGRCWCTHNKRKIAKKYKYYTMEEAPEFGTEKLKRAWSATDSNPYDMESWSLIIRDAQNRNIDTARPIFERLVGTFPTTGKFWKMYIEQEMRSYNFEKVEKVYRLYYFIPIHINKKFILNRSFS